MVIVVGVHEKSKRCSIRIVGAIKISNHKIV